ncbi:MAG: flavodoxin [Oscillospiraceae bacterium]|nr:flavodoxin [Oscillospiraceae bacterium]
MKSIVIFFSRADENYVSGTIKRLDVGNTEIAAGIVAKASNSDIFKVEPINDYPEDYNECIAQAKAEQQRNARPALKALPQNLSDYDTIYLGYPNYWGTMPMPMFTLLESCDLGGKTIMPFCTHEGSGLGSSESDIKKLCPNSNVKSGLAIHGSRLDRAEALVDKWLN